MIIGAKRIAQGALADDDEEDTDIDESEAVVQGLN
jgi:hypothetical protein